MLNGPGCHIGVVLVATDVVLTDVVLTAVEIIDSRYKDSRFDLKSVVADNTPAAGYVVGGRSLKPTGLGMPILGVVIEKNGAIVEVGARAAVPGHPPASLAMLANMMAARGEGIPAGIFIMAGEITMAVAVEAGDNINVPYQDLGKPAFRFG